MIMRWSAAHGSRARRVVRIILCAPLILAAVGMFVTGMFQIFGGGSMAQGHGVSPGAVITGSFSYEQRLDDGRTVRIPVRPMQASDLAGPARGAADVQSFRIVMDSDRLMPGNDIRKLEREHKLGPLQPGAPGFVDLPEEVRFDTEESDDLWISAGPRQSLYLPWVGWKGRLLVMLPPTLTVFALGAAFLTFASLLGSIVDGRPFAPQNPARLLRLGGFLALAAVASSWLQGWIGQAVLAVTVDHGHDVPLHVTGPPLDLIAIFLAAAAVTLAFAFRTGTRLTTDADGLV